MIREISDEKDNEIRAIYREKGFEERVNVGNSGDRVREMEDIINTLMNIFRTNIISVTF